MTELELELEESPAAELSAVDVGCVVRYTDSEGGSAVGRLLGFRQVVDYDADAKALVRRTWLYLEGMPSESVGSAATVAVWREAR